FFLSYSSCVHRHLHSFPTRRSSDLFFVQFGFLTLFNPSKSCKTDVFVQHLHLSKTNSLHQVELEIQRSWRIFLSHVVQHLFSIVDRKSTRLNSSHVKISYAVFCLKK